MRVLLLSPYPERIAHVFSRDHLTVTADPINDTTASRCDALVSFGYRHILNPETIAATAGRCCNIHISMLPWNKGADPNFWSWYEGTPKGVTIHAITSGIDRGPIIAQREVPMRAEDHTLKTSYEILIDAAVQLFEDNWPQIAFNPDTASHSGGSYHKRCDAAPIIASLPLGYNTPCVDIEDMGAEAMMSAMAVDKIADEIEAMRRSSAK